MNGDNKDEAPVELFGEILDDRKDAVLFFDGTEEAWLPKSLIEVEDETDGVTITLPEWLAIDKDLV